MMPLPQSILYAAILASAASQTLRIEQVFPSGPLLSQHTLRISIRFKTAPPGSVLPRLALHDDDGRTLQNAFLEQELWSPDRKALTLLFDPGRLKSGIGRHNDLGTPLNRLSRVTLTLDGDPIKVWLVGGRACLPIDPAAWRIEPPRAGTRSPLRIEFPDPVDIQSEPLLAVVAGDGHRVGGNERLTQFESVWLFTPTKTWDAGDYRIQLHPRFENACGDEGGDSFEHRIHPVESRVPLPMFTIGREN